MKLYSSTFFNQLPFHIETGKTFGGYDMHSHDFSEIGIVLSGSGVHKVGHNAYNFREGYIFVITGDVSHSFEKLDDVLFCNIKYQYDYFSFLFNSLNARAEFNYLIRLHHVPGQSPFKTHFYLPPVELEKMKLLLEELEVEFNTASLGYEAMVQSLFLKTVVILLRNYQLSDIEKNTLKGLSNSISFLETHFREPICLEDLVEKSFMSRSLFLRQFKNAMGYSPIQYLNNLRLEYACQLMQNPKLSLTEIARESGFSDLNYFSRLFRKSKGCSPKKFRQAIG